MPRDVKYGGPKKDRPAEAMAKGKFGKSYTNELFAQVNDFMYEFGIIGKPHGSDNQEDKNND